MKAIQKLPRTVGTHNGTFHVDEVTACALLIIYDLVDQAGVHRTRDPDLLARCEFVCDVGGLYQPDQHLFDHHQADYQGELSSAGMILKWLEESKTVDPGEAAYFRNNLVDGVDAHDNGRALLVKGVSTFSNIISQFAPVSYEASEAEQNKAFEEALRFTIGMLKRMRQRYIYSRSCRSL
ncbi:MAG: MYG1 family protein, partial [Chlamydiia bacterium]|nr:MYG1 family protein [Chlamydiia bacterium]